MSNVPDDWGAYGGTCSECGQYWHKSGEYECACVETFRCEKHFSWGQCEEEVEDEDELTQTFDGEMWCKGCIDDEAFTCEVCGDIFPDEELAEIDLTMDVYMCKYCDEEAADNKTLHHTPVEIPIGHLKYILFTMENMAQEKPYEHKPGTAKEWLREGIKLMKQSMPKEESTDHREATVVLVEEVDETTSERIVRAQVQGGTNADH